MSIKKYYIDSIFFSFYICIYLHFNSSCSFGNNSLRYTCKNFTSAAIKIAHHFFLVKTFVVTDPYEVHRVLIFLTRTFSDLEI